MNTEVAKVVLKTNQDLHFSANNRATVNGYLLNTHIKNTTLNGDSLKAVG